MEKIFGYLLRFVPSYGQATVNLLTSPASHFSLLNRKTGYYPEALLYLGVTLLLSYVLSWYRIGTDSELESQLLLGLVLSIIKYSLVFSAFVLSVSFLRTPLSGREKIAVCAYMEGLILLINSGIYSLSAYFVESTNELAYRFFLVQDPNLRIFGGLRRRIFGLEETVASGPSLENFNLALGTQVIGSFLIFGFSLCYFLIIWKTFLSRVALPTGPWVKSFLVYAAIRVFLIGLH